MSSVIDSLNGQKELRQLNENKEKAIREVNQQARFTATTLERILICTTKENANHWLRPTRQVESTFSKYTTVNRNNAELRDLMRQARRDMVRLEKLMEAERKGLW